MGLQPWKKAVSVRFSGDNNHRIPGLKSGPAELSETVQKTFIIRIEPCLVPGGDLYSRPWHGDSLAVPCAPWGSRIRDCGESVARKSVPDKSLTLKNGSHRSR